MVMAKSLLLMRPSSADPAARKRRRREIGQRENMFDFQRVNAGFGTAYFTICRKLRIFALPCGSAE
jgi:hypothetical protein